MSNPSNFFWGTGRRKTSVARVRLQEGEGKIIINGRPVENFFPSVSQREIALAALQATGMLEKCNVFVNVVGGGITGQAGAILLGIARALCKLSPNLEEKLRSHGYLTRDSRMKERKKYGHRAARASFQFSKR